MSRLPSFLRGFRFDCSQWVYPGPKRVFTPQEMALGGQQPWPVMLDRYLLFNVVVILSTEFAIKSPAQARLSAGLGLLLTLCTLVGGRALWRSPTRARLNLLSYLVGALFIGVTLAAMRVFGRDSVREVLPQFSWVFVAMISAWWALTVYRFHQIEARLRELNEQDAALRLSTQLAAAQIQPHFLFNTLASLQHWVDTRDERAAPLLRDFTAYLRATLPMFERELQPLANEIEMVRRYLAIMQARLGPRLAFAIDVPADASAQLPPGVVLTLVENAIAHGIEPQLRGGRIAIAARRDGEQLRLTVRDDGPGLAPGWAEGVGLSNTRRRLQQALPAATLTLADAAPGCIATLTL